MEREQDDKKASRARGFELQFINDILSITLLFNCLRMCSCVRREKATARYAYRELYQLWPFLRNLISSLWPYIISSTLKQAPASTRRRRTSRATTTTTTMKKKESEESWAGSRRELVQFTWSCLCCASTFPVQSDCWWFGFYVCDLCAPDHFRLTFASSSSYLAPFNLIVVCRRSILRFCYDSVFFFLTIFLL